MFVSLIIVGSKIFTQFSTLSYECCRSRMYFSFDILYNQVLVLARVEEVVCVACLVELSEAGKGDVFFVFLCLGCNRCKRVNHSRVVLNYN